ncbi:MAG: alpha/beta fold hydrolase [Anaerolineales bacterium]|jgi:dipeptidyl aminopeptidase/acylaminoacyl peptidase|nr:alpha/beta fold hydrolase [Anaerolineales bacterium]
MNRLFLLVLLAVLILTACESPTPAETAPPPIAEPALPSRSNVGGTDPVSTATVGPATSIIPATATVSLPPTPSAAVQLYPLSIAAQQAMAYPGSDIIIERELTAALNYRRYYAYYYSEDLKIYGLLTVPTVEMPTDGWPAIVFNHGYIPPDVYRTTERYIAYVDRLASSGYVVFRIDYRGHDQSEGEATGAYGDPGYTIDVMNAVAAIKRYREVNPEEIGMWGHSMGGYLTLRAMVLSRDVKAGVIWAGVVASYPDLICCWRRTGNFTPSPSSRSPSWRTGWAELYGSPESNPEFWASISSNSYLADLSGPIQLHHGTKDEDVPVEFSIKLADQINAAGGSVELYTYPNDNHNISNYFTIAMNRSIEFFDRYLKE